MSETFEQKYRQSIRSRLKEVGIAVPILTVEYDRGVIVHVWYMHPHKREAEAIDLIDYMDILQIRKVIDADNQAAIQLVIDGYLSEKDTEEQMSEIAEPENGNEEPKTPIEDEPVPDDDNDNGEESEASE